MRQILFFLKHFYDESIVKSILDLQLLEVTNGKSDLDFFQTERGNFLLIETES